MWFIQKDIIPERTTIKVLIDQNPFCPKIMGVDGCNLGNIFSIYTIVKILLWASATRLLDKEKEIVVLSL